MVPRCLRCKEVIQTPHSGSGAKLDSFGNWFHVESILKAMFLGKAVEARLSFGVAPEQVFIDRRATKGRTGH